MTHIIYEAEMIHLGENHNTKKCKNYSEIFSDLYHNNT